MAKITSETIVDRVTTGVDGIVGADGVVISY